MDTRSPTKVDLKKPMVQLGVVEHVPLPVEEMTDIYLSFKYENAGLLQHLGINRSYSEKSYAANVEKLHYNKFASPQDNVLRTNLMYIAYEMKNVKNTVIHFTRFGLLGWDTKDLITSKNHERLMALLLLEQLSKLDRSKLPLIEKALTESENHHVWELLQSDAISYAIEPALNSTNTLVTTPPDAPIASTSAAAGTNATKASGIDQLGSGGSADKLVENVAGPSRLRHIPEIVDLAASPSPPPVSNNYWTCPNCESPTSEAYSSCLVCNIPRRSASDAAASGSNGWVCMLCAVQNFDHLCCQCGASRYYSQGSEGKNDWDCPACTYKNPLNIVNCVICTHARSF